MKNDDAEPKPNPSTSTTTTAPPASNANMANGMRVELLEERTVFDENNGEVRMDCSDGEPTGATATPDTATPSTSNDASRLPASTPMSPVIIAQLPGPSKGFRTRRNLSRKARLQGGVQVKPLLPVESLNHTNPRNDGPSVGSLYRADQRGDGDSKKKMMMLLGEYIIVFDGNRKVTQVGTHRYCPGMIVCGAEDGSVAFLKEVEAKVQLENMIPSGAERTHQRAINAFSFFSDGKRFISSSLDSSLILWSSEDRGATRQLLDIPNLGKGIASIDLDASDNLLAVGMANGDVNLVDVRGANGSMKMKITNKIRKLHPDVVRKVRFFPEIQNGLLHSCGELSLRCLHDVTTENGETRIVNEDRRAHKLMTLDISPFDDPRCVAVAGAKPVIDLYDLDVNRKNPFVRSYDLPNGHGEGPVHSVEFSWTQSFLAAATECQITLWDFRLSDDLNECIAGYNWAPSDSKKVTCLAHSSDFEKVIVGFSDGSVALLTWE